MLEPRFKAFLVFLLISPLQVCCLLECGGPRSPLAYDTNRRRRTLLAHSDLLHQTSTSVIHPFQTIKQCNYGSDEDDILQNENDEQVMEQEDAVPPTLTESSVRSATLASRVKMWPPWPLSLLGKKSNEADEDGVVTAENTFPSAAALFWAYFKQRARIGVRQFQEIGSELWFHLPPAAPPLILLASFPQTIITENKAAGVALSKRVVPLLSVPFARNFVLSGVGLALMSWAHTELNRKRKLTPLSSLAPYGSVSRVFLPPFLPAEVPEPELEALVTEEKTAQNQNVTSPESGESNVLSLVGPKIRSRFNHLYENAPRPGIFREWKRVRATHKREAAKIHRLTIFDELVALQAIKRKSERLRQLASGEEPRNKKNSGYALVTGASHGIGRAIAVELARWEIPLILVARNTERLVSLAYDLEACYGVRCCILSADLSEMNAAERIHEATEKAGITVDILVNNAGIAADGLSVDMETRDLEQMMMINTMSFAKLSQLYGKDMKRRRRGRILMVSSMSGLTSSSPNCALYGATKAFGKSLALSMAKELEPYGIGVTCLLPGPVKDTQFRDRSGTNRALCWHLPFYPKSPESVAHLGVMALLDGDVQVIPGWQNRVFAKIFRPIIPQRVETMCVHAAWSPFHMPRIGRFGRGSKDDDDDPDSDVDADEANDDNLLPLAEAPLDLKPRYSFQPPPRLLTLPTPKPEPQTSKTPTSEPTSPQKEEESVPLDSREYETDDEATVEENTLVEPSFGSSTQEKIPAADSAKEPISNTERETNQQPADPEQENPADQVGSDTAAGDQNGRIKNGGNDDIIKTNDTPESRKETKEQAIKKEEIPSGSDGVSDETCVGTKRKRQEKPRSIRIRGFDDEDDDLGLSPELGPIDLFQNRKFVLPKAKIRIAEDGNVFV